MFDGVVSGLDILGFGHRLLARCNRGAVARDMTDHPIGVAVLDQGFVQARRQATDGKFGEGAREGGLAGHLVCALPAAQTAQRFIGGQNLDQQRRRRKVENRLGHKGPSQRRARAQRPTRHASNARHQRVDPRQPKHTHQLLVGTQRTQGFVQPRQKFVLNV